MTSVPTAAYGSAERALCDQSSSDRLSVFCQGSKQTKQRQAGRGDNAFRESAVCLRDVGVTVMASRQRPGLSSATSATINNNIQQAQTGSRLLPPTRLPCSLSFVVRCRCHCHVPFSSTCVPNGKLQPRPGCGL